MEIGKASFLCIYTYTVLAAYSTVHANKAIAISCPSAFVHVGEGFKMGLVLAQ